MKPGRLPSGPFNATIRSRSTTKTISRVTRQKTAVGDFTENASTHKEDVYLFQASEAPQQLDRGVHFGKTLNGLALPGANLEDGDRLDHDNITYEMTVTGVPTEDSPNVLRLRLTDIEDQ